MSKKLTRQMILDYNPATAVILCHSDIDFMKNESAFNSLLKGLGIKEKMTWCSESFTTETDEIDGLMKLHHYLMRNETKNQYFLITVCEEGNRFDKITQSISHFFPCVKHFKEGLYSFKYIVYNRIPKLPIQAEYLFQTFVGEVGDILFFDDGSFYVYGGYDSELQSIKSPTDDISFLNKKDVISIKHVVDLI